MEPFTVGLITCGSLAAVYQLLGAPFILNLCILCIIGTSLLYVICVTSYYIPTDTVFLWVYPSAKEMHREETGSTCDIIDPDDEITKKLREFTGHVVRDFILSWYNAVTDDVTFVQEAFEMFESILSGARKRASTINKKKLLANILNEIMDHILNFENACAGVPKTEQARTLDDVQRRDQLIAVHYFSSHSHVSTSSLPASEMEYLRGIVRIILKGLLPEHYELNETPLYLVRELIAQNVVCSLLNLMSDPLWIYNTLTRILEDSDDMQHASGMSKIIQSCTDSHGLQENEGIKVPESEACHQHHTVEDTTDDVLMDSGYTEYTDQFPLCRNQPRTLSHQSIDSSDDITITRTLNDELPLPLNSSEMHFAPEWSSGDHDGHSMRKHMLSLATERSPQEKLFHRVRIVDYAVMKENFDDSKKYALYKITYHTVEKQCKEYPACANSERQENQGDISQQLHTKRHEVQRRFREFLVLQERLSQNMVAKNLITDIKGPSRMFPVPFGNMDKEYILQRKKFLQAYLRELSAIPFVSHTQELREFLAYEMDPRLAYVKKPDPIPRFDKLFKSAIQDLLGTATMKISSSLPSDDVYPYENMQNVAGCSTFVSKEVNNIGAVTKLKNKVFGASKHLADDRATITRTSRQYAPHEGERGQNIMEIWKDEEDLNFVTRCIDEEGNRPSFRGYGDGCDSFGVIQPLESAIVPSAVLFRLIHTIWNVPHGKHRLVTLSCVKYIQAYLDRKINDLTSEQSWTKYIGELNESLWPGGEWESDDKDRATWMTASDDVKNNVLERAHQCLEAELPTSLKYLSPGPAYERGITQLLNSFQHPNINRQLICKIMDLLLLELFPEFGNMIGY